MIPSARPDADDKTARLWQKFFLRQTRASGLHKKDSTFALPAQRCLPGLELFFASRRTKTLIWFGFFLSVASLQKDIQNGVDS